MTLNDAANETIAVNYGSNKQFVFGTLPGGLSYDTKKTAVILDTDFNEDTIDLNDSLTSYYVSTLKTINATATTRSLTLIGNKIANTIYAGLGDNTLNGGLGNDVLIGNSGNDAFVYDADGSKDIIQKFGENDIIKLNTTTTISTANFTEKGSDIVLTVGKGTLTIKDHSTRNPITVEQSDGTIFTYKPLPLGLTYNAKKSLITVDKNFDAAIDVSTFGVEVSEINASAATNALNVKAGSNDLKLTMGKGGGSMTGSSGNDTMIAGKGIDVFITSSGSDIVDKYAAKQDVIRIANGDNLISGTIDSKFKDVTLTTSRGTLTVKGIGGKELKIVDSNGVEMIYLSGAR